MQYFERLGSYLRRGQARVYLGSGFKILGLKIFLTEPLITGEAIQVPKSSNL